MTQFLGCPTNWGYWEYMQPVGVRKHYDTIQSSDYQKPDERFLVKKRFANPRETSTKFNKVNHLMQSWKLRGSFKNYTCDKPQITMPRVARKELAPYPGSNEHAITRAREAVRSVYFANKEAKEAGLPPVST